MFRYSGPLLSFVVVAVCLGINITRYPIVWEMMDKTALAVNTTSQEQDQVAQTETEPKAALLKEGTPVPPPLGGSPSSPSSRTLFTTNLSKIPPDNVSSSGYEPIPAPSVPNPKVANLASPPIEENEVTAELMATNENEFAQEEEDLSDYQPVLSQPIYAARYVEQPPEPEEIPNKYEESKELTPEEKVEAFKNSPLDLVPADDSKECSKKPEW